MQINAFDVHLFWLVPLSIGGVWAFCGPPKEKHESENKNKTKISRMGRGWSWGSPTAHHHPSDRAGGHWGRCLLGLQPEGLLRGVVGWEAGSVNSRF